MPKIHLKDAQSMLSELENLKKIIKLDVINETIMSLKELIKITTTFNSAQPNEEQIDFVGAMPSVFTKLYTRIATLVGSLDEETLEDKALNIQIFLSNPEYVQFMSGRTLDSENFDDGQVQSTSSGLSSQGSAPSLSSQWSSMLSHREEYEEADWGEDDDEEQDQDQDQGENNKSRP